MFAAVVFVSFLYLVEQRRPRLGTGQARCSRACPSRHLRVDHRPCRRPARADAGRGGLGATMGLEDLQHNFLTGRLEDLVKWARRNSVWPATFGLACCAIEMMAVGRGRLRHQPLRDGGLPGLAPPGRPHDRRRPGLAEDGPVLRQVYDQMMEPKWVISMGVCASTGGMFNNYAIVQGVDQIVPVDVYAPGCPPGPETLLHAILTLHEKIRTGEITRRPGPADPAGEPATAGWVPEPCPTRCGWGRRGERAAPTAAPRSCAASGVLPEVPRLPDRAGRPAGPSRSGTRTTTWSARSATPGSRCCADLTAVDYLTHPGRSLPDGVAPERFEVVVNLLSLVARASGCGSGCRSRGRPGRRRSSTSTRGRGHGARGLRHVRHPLHRPPRPHPDPHARGLGGPPAAQGLRVGRVPVQFKEAPGPTMSRRRDRRRRHDAPPSRRATATTTPVRGETSRGPRSSARARPRRSSCASEVGAVLRLPEGARSTRATSTSSAATTRR